MADPVGHFEVFRRYDMIEETRRMRYGQPCPDCRTGLVFVSHFEKHPTLKRMTAVLASTDCFCSEYAPEIEYLGEEQ